ncbi:MULTISPECIES: HNH endonuclease signature motif containing protein [Sphingobacterium]|uniref:HNH endonuclease signature motif containing protein n=1 Tax=Sphingobacterium TaxID=28453 RepID=UPI0025808F56|nr:MULTISPECIES: HNH endonuclease signature motif containing protein [Sphingobacterium]
MADFRLLTPKRRNITAKVSSHGGHRDDLKIDFGNRCGYCNSPDRWKTTYFEIDHFIPVAILTIKTPTDYSNLVYSCRSCNNAKRKKWPTKDENFPNKNEEGFIDPCDDLYNHQFGRNENGEIIYRTNLGKWMYYELKFHKPQHRVIWNLEQLEDSITEIKKLLKKSVIPEKLKDKIISTLIKYTDYVDDWRCL